MPKGAAADGAEDPCCLVIVVGGEVFGAVEVAFNIDLGVAKGIGVGEVMAGDGPTL